MKDTIRNILLAFLAVVIVVGEIGRASGRERVFRAV